MSSKTLTVGADQTYTTVQQAINAIYAEEDPTGWTIEIESGSYLQFAIPKELDGLTVKAADGATVTIATWTEDFDEALTATPNSTTSSNSYYNTQGYRYVFSCVFVQAEDVTFDGLTFTLGTATAWKYWDGTSYTTKSDGSQEKVYSNYTVSVSQPAADSGEWEADSSGWYRACITDLGGYSNGKTMSTGMTVKNCNFISEEQGYTTTYPTGSTYSAYGLLFGASTSWTVTNCSFDKLSSAICFMCDNYAVSSDGITVTGNTFTNCDRAMDGYYGGAPAGTAGTLTFANNVVIGSSDLRSKIVVMDQASKGSIGAVSITGNTFYYTMVLMENMAESSCAVNDIFDDNTFDTSSYYVEGDGWYYSGSYHGSITVSLPDAAYYEAPEDDTGKWVLNVNLDSIGSNTEGATEAVQAIIDAANKEGSHTLNITWADTDETTLLYTVTAFKDCIYWVSSSSEKTSEPGLEKKILIGDGEEVTEVDQTSASTNDTITFQLTSNVPKGLDTYNEYTLTFHDILDDALTLNEDSFTVKIGDTELEADTDYTLAISTEDDPLEDDCTFELSIVLTDIEGIEEGDEIVVTYTAELTTTTPGAYYNEAWVTYLDDESEHNKVEVDTYGISVFKYDASSYTTGDDGTITYAALSGAEFTLYSDEALEDEDVIGTYTSGDDGYLTISGLAEGTYYLVETEAPSGYVASSSVIEIVIPDDANAETFWAYASVPNAPVPGTGGTGTAMYTTVGVIILLAAGCVFLFSRKKRESD